ncbi:MAG: hypothetical protein HY053_01055 [Proteobacteria bacterium]|nr:hypothetical protein [Pseudomonadota bacterium]
MGEKRAGRHGQEGHIQRNGKQRGQGQTQAPFLERQAHMQRIVEKLHEKEHQFSAEAAGVVVGEKAAHSGKKQAYPGRKRLGGLGDFGKRGFLARQHQ